VLPPGEYEKLNTIFFGIHQVAALFALCGSGKESFNPILDPDADPDQHQNLITSKLGKA